MSTPYPTPHKSWIRWFAVAYWDPDVLANLFDAGSSSYYSGTLTIGAANSVTATQYDFQSTDVGKTLTITGGTGFTPGAYTISSVNTGTGAATLSTSPGTQGSTGGTGSMLNSGGMFAVQNYDIFDGTAYMETGGAQEMAAIVAATNATQLAYDNFYAQSVASGAGDTTNVKDAQMLLWCAATESGQSQPNYALYGFANAAACYNSMFLHFNASTTVDFGDGNGAKTLPAGSRVPTYGWKGNVGSIGTGSEVLTNPASAAFIAFNAWFQLWTIANVPGIAGIFVDNTTYDPTGGQLQMGTVSNVGSQLITETTTGSNPGAYTTVSGTYSETTGWSLNAVAGWTLANLPAVFEAAHAGGYPIWCNGSALATYSTSTDQNFTTIWPYITGTCREEAISLGANDTNRTSAWAYMLSEMAASHVNSPPVPQCLSLQQTYYLPGGTFSPSAAISMLAQYYILAQPTLDPICTQGTNGPYTAAPSVVNIPAIQYNIGSQVGSPYIFATIFDPGNNDGPTPNTFTSTTSGSWNSPSSGGQYVMTDSTAPWGSTNWAGGQLCDSTGNVFYIYQSTTTTISLYYGVPPAPANVTPAAGLYRLTTGHFAKVWAQEYTNGVAFWRPLPDDHADSYVDTGADTAVPLSLSSLTSSTDAWYLLNGDFDGTVSNNTPQTILTLQNLEGAIIVNSITSPGSGSTTATSYTLSGPTSGIVSEASTDFTVSPTDGDWPSGVTITPHSTGSGTFSPTSFSPSGSSSATFTYTPSMTTGSPHTISTTNSGTMTDPSGVAYTVNPATATTYTLSGPSSGTVGQASTNFTVAPTGGSWPAGTTITPADTLGGTFTPASVSPTGANSATFTITPAAAGTDTISVTNNQGLTNPSSLSLRRCA